VKEIGRTNDRMSAPCLGAHQLRRESCGARRLLCCLNRIMTKNRKLGPTFEWTGNLKNEVVIACNTLSLSNTGAKCVPASSKVLAEGRTCCIESENLGQESSSELTAFHFEVEAEA
jgi:hypothetical protein